MDSEHEPPAPHEHDDPAGRARGTARLGMTLIERLSATVMIPDGDEQQLAEIQELVRATADALAGDDRDAARVRLLARELAIQKNVLDLMTVQVGIRPSGRGRAWRACRGSARHERGQAARAADRRTSGLVCARTENRRRHRERRGCPRRGLPVTRWSYNLIKIRLATIRAAMLPREFATKTSVPLVVGDRHTVDVAIETIEGRCYGGRRRWLRCPNSHCASKTVVIAFDPLSGLFGCRKCMSWRSRVATAAPHTHATIQIGR